MAGKTTAAMVNVTFNNIATQIMLKAKSIGLDVYFETPTIGDGNCFYHAVVECVRNLENFEDNHHTLRLKVVDFVHQNRDADFVLD